jgi:hypothetical protein
LVVRVEEPRLERWSCVITLGAAGTEDLWIPQTGDDDAVDGDDEGGLGSWGDSFKNKDIGICDVLSFFLIVMLEVLQGDLVVESLFLVNKCIRPWSDDSHWVIGLDEFPFTRISADLDG